MAIADPIISRVKKIAIHCSLVMVERCARRVLCVSLPHTLDSPVVPRQVCGQSPGCSYTYYCLVCLRVGFISLNPDPCGMTRHSASRGVLYTAPPTEEELEENAEQSADD